jgi:hypothetical protein
MFNVLAVPQTYRIFTRTWTSWGPCCQDGIALTDVNRFAAVSKDAAKIFAFKLFDPTDGFGF